MEVCLLFKLVLWVRVVTGYKINSESNIDKQMRTVQFFNIYFKKFKYILLSNILFFVYILLTAAVEYVLYALLGGLNIFVLALSIIFLNPFFAGIALVSRYIYIDKEFSVTEAFFRGVKENWKKSLIHGIILYAVFIVSYLSISMYYSGTKVSSLFWVPLIITAVIALFVLFSSYYANIMTVTMDIRLRDIYRNCALFSFGEIKNNLLTTVALLIFSAIIFTICIIAFDPILLLIIGAVLTALIIPSTVQYIITFYVYDDMVAVLDKSLKDDGSNKKNTADKISLDNDDLEEISKFVPEGEDEYIFHNGRMIKRSIVEKMYRDNE